MHFDSIVDDETKRNDDRIAEKSNWNHDETNEESIIPDVAMHKRNKKTASTCPINKMTLIYWVEKIERARVKNKTKQEDNGLKALEK